MLACVAASACAALRPNPASEPPARLGCPGLPLVGAGNVGVAATAGGACAIDFVDAALRPEGGAAASDAFLDFAAFDDAPSVIVLMEGRTGAATLGPLPWLGDGVDLRVLPIAYGGLRRPGAPAPGAGGGLAGAARLDGVETAISPVGDFTTYGADGGSGLATATTPAGGITTYRRAAAGTLVQVQDADGQTTTYAYDTQNRLIGVTDPFGLATTYAYDGQDRVVAIAWPGRSWRYRYPPPLPAASDTFANPNRDVVEAANRPFGPAMPARPKWPEGPHGKDRTADDRLPEPSSMSLLGAAIAVLLLARRRRPHGARPPRGQTNKSFLFLFFKKESAFFFAKKKQKTLIL